MVNPAKIIFSHDFTQGHCSMGMKIGERSAPEFLSQTVIKLVAIFVGQSLQTFAVCARAEIISNSNCFLIGG
jgi:hypothetical protein